MNPAATFAVAVLAGYALVNAVGWGLSAAAWRRHCRRTVHLPIPPGATVACVAMVLVDNDGDTVCMRADATGSNTDLIDSHLIHLALRTDEDDPAHDPHPTPQPDQTDHEGDT